MYESIIWITIFSKGAPMTVPDSMSIKSFHASQELHLTGNPGLDFHRAKAYKN